MGGCLRRDLVAAGPVGGGFDDGSLVMGSCVVMLIEKVR